MAVRNGGRCSVARDHGLPERGGAQRQPGAAEPGDPLSNPRVLRWSALLMVGRRNDRYEPVERRESVLNTIHCRRCGTDEAPRLGRAPFKNELGQRIIDSICQACWAEWLQHQTLLINHYGLDPRDPESRAFLYKQVDEVLLGDGTARQIDTSKKGEIEW